jgi:hypothetical protein
MIVWLIIIVFVISREIEYFVPVARAVVDETLEDWFPGISNISAEG